MAAEGVVEAARDFRMEREMIPITDKIGNMLVGGRGAGQPKLSFRIIIELFDRRDHLLGC